MHSESAACARKIAYKKAETYEGASLFFRPDEMAELDALQNQVALQQAQIDGLLAPRPARPTLPKVTFSNNKGEDWLSFKRSFLDHSQFFGYDDETRRKALTACMRGAASAATTDIRVTNYPPAVLGAPAHPPNPTFDEVVAAYEQRFLPAAASELARTQFEHSLQRKGEDVLAFHSRVRDLYLRAYPGQNDPTVIIRRFALGLLKKEVRMRILRGPAATFHEALLLAQSEVAAQDTDRAWVGGQVNLASYNQPTLGQGEEPMEIGMVQEDQEGVAVVNPGTGVHGVGFGNRPGRGRPQQQRPSFPRPGRQPQRQQPMPLAARANMKCYSCGKMGHIAAHCRKKGRKVMTENRGGGGKRRPPGPGRINAVGTEWDSGTEEEDTVQQVQGEENWDDELEAWDESHMPGKTDF